MIVDSEEGESVCLAEDVSCFPTVKIFSSGAVVDTVEGAKEDQLRRLLSDQRRVSAPLPASFSSAVVSESVSAASDKDVIPSTRISSVTSATDLRRIIDRCNASNTLLAVVSTELHFAYMSVVVVVVVVACVMSQC